LRKAWADNLDTFYAGIGKSRSKGYHQAIRRTRRILTWVFVAWTAICTILVLMAHYEFGFSRDKKTVPLFSGPPEFIILAIIIALAAYLRAIRAEAAKLRDTIKSGAVWNFPLREPYLSLSTAKLVLLDEIIETLGIAGSFVIALFVVVGVRILADSILRFSSDEAQKSSWLFITDFVIACWIVAIFAALTIAHGRARSHDDDIRAIARDCEDEILASRTEIEPTKQVSHSQSVSRARVSGRSTISGGLLIGLSMTCLMLIGRQKR
jgi:hypothetical protein